jgi:two-component system phosphate regulon sensor histidine kinase PhoR
MNRKVITIIIVLTSISLVAALITQLLWVRDAWHLKEDQYNNSVKISLKSVVNQIMASTETYNSENIDTNNTAYREHIDLFSVVHPVVLDSLLRAEFNSMQIRGDYYYGVYRESDQKFVMGNEYGFVQRLISSPHQISLTCLCQTENYLLSIYFPDQKSIVISQMIILPVMSGLFLMVLVFSFFFTIYFIIRQKKLSEMKSDFINNTTHEFKTPISTISVSSEMLKKDLVVNSPEKVKKYAKIIFDENARLKTLVERVLQIAIFDKEEDKLVLIEQDVHEIAMECIHNFKIHVAERNGCLRTRFDAENHILATNREHLKNILNNLLDNANKYSPESPHITVSTYNLNGSVYINVEDKGIGIDKENQQAVFKKFHRLQRGDIHDVKGFGIGLYYVKSIVEKLGGKVELKSELNKGSCFILSFPL